MTTNKMKIAELRKVFLEFGDGETFDKLTLKEAKRVCNKIKLITALVEETENFLAEVKGREG